MCVCVCVGGWGGGRSGILGEFYRKPHKIETVAVSVAYPRCLEGHPPPHPPESKFFQFHAVFGKLWENRMLAPYGGLTPPSRENHVSANECILQAGSQCRKFRSF